jgi:hypothetical protein
MLHFKVILMYLCVVNLGVGGVAEVKPTLPKSLGNVKPVRTDGKYEYLPIIYRVTLRSR